MSRIIVNDKALDVDASARHAAALGAARSPGHDRHEVRLRHGAVRRLHRACRRLAVRSCVLPLGALAGKAHHHHRGPVGRPQSRRAEGLDRARRAAVRLLPVGPDHVGGGAAARTNPQPTTPTSTRPWRATSAAAAPTRGSARPSIAPPSCQAPDRASLSGSGQTPRILPRAARPCAAAAACACDGAAGIRRDARGRERPPRAPRPRR